MKRVAAVLVAVMATAGTLVFDALAGAAPPGDDEVIAFEVRGVGNGHGRGFSQWGGLGRALAGQTWGDILGTYYQGTQPGNRTEAHLRVRLTGWDGAGTVGVISASGTARWNSNTTNYRSLKVEETAKNEFTVYGSTTERGCPGGVDLTIPFVDLDPGMTNANVARMQEFLNHFGFDAGAVDGQFGPMTVTAVEAFQLSESLFVDGKWRIEEANAARARVDASPDPVAWQQLAANVTGPITFKTTKNQTTADSAEVLGLCRSSGAVTHYRGRIDVVDTTDGNRVVNDLDVENYLRGVIPKEVPATWGDQGGGKGMHALRAQAVAARSFGMSQHRYAYAGTCDTSSCQVYGGAATRITAVTDNYLRVEHVNTDEAIVDTAGVVRVWPGGDIVSTEFSASNGPRTAGGAFPPVNDPFDDQPGNPYHRWTRIIDADAIRSTYGLATANGVVTAPEAGSAYDGIWANEVRLGNGSTVSAWNFRNAFGLPAPGFELVPIRRTVTGAADFAFIGDSVGASIAEAPTSYLRVVTEGMFDTERFDAIPSRRTQGGSIADGVSAASKVQSGTDLVVVELGYNDDPASMPGRIDAVMTALRARNVGQVLWVNVSERRDYPYDVTNQALQAATGRWVELGVLDWDAASSGSTANRWFSDGVHLTATGRAKFSLWLRERILQVVVDGYTPPRALRAREVLRVPVLGRFGVPESGVAGVSLNVTAVGPAAAGWLRVWSCGSGEPETSSVNFASAGAVEPNAVVVPVDETGEVCVLSSSATDVVVDVGAWFESGVRQATGRIVDTRYGIGPAPGG
jgi:peptidoglycan hydrolase-like protein with peptidoglycan-binding domain